MACKYAYDIYENYLIRHLKIDTYNIDEFTVKYYLIELDLYVSQFKFIKNRELSDFLMTYYDVKYNNNIVARYSTTGHVYVNHVDIFNRGYKNYKLNYKFQELNIIRYLNNKFGINIRCKYLIQDSNLIGLNEFCSPNKTF